MILFIYALLAQIPGGDAYGLYEDEDLFLNEKEIFSNFYEDSQNQKLLEDERFFSYGRFFALNFSIGLTTFDGTRGTAYENNHPSFGGSFMLFTDMQNAYGLGYIHSKHYFVLEKGTNYYHDRYNDSNKGIGMIDVNMNRIFLFYRYYANVADLGTAITFSNPYFTISAEYWLFTNKFTDQREMDNENGHGIAIALGAGLEFPIKLKESFLNIEALYHLINFSDKNTKAYAPYLNNHYGYEDFAGNSTTITMSYVLNW